MQRIESENESNEIVIHQLPSPPATRTKNFSFASTYQPSTGQFIKTQSNDAYLPNSKLSKPVSSFSLLNYDDIYETAPFVSRKPNAIVHPIRRSEQKIQHDTEEQQQLQQLQEEPENDSDSTNTAHSLSYQYEVSGSSVTQPPISRPLFNYAHDFADELDRKLRYLYSRHARPGWNTTGYENPEHDSEKHDKDKDDINSSELPHRPLFITTVPTGIFLPPPKEMPLPQFLRPYSYYSRPMVLSERHTSCFDESPPFPKDKLREFAAPIKKVDNFTTSKTAPPSILSSSSRVNDSYSDSLTSGVHLTKEQFQEQIQQRRGKREAPKEPYKNVMFDRRVVRGSNFSKNRKQTHNETSEHYAEERYHHTLGQRPTKERLKRSARSKTRKSNQRDEIIQTDDEILPDFKTKADDVSVNTQTDILSFPNDPFEGDSTKTRVHYEMFEHSYEQRHYHKLFRGTEIMQLDKIIQTGDDLLTELVMEHYETSKHSVSGSLYYKLANEPTSGKRERISRARSLESTFRNLNGHPDDELLIELKKKRDNLCSVNTQTEPLVLPNHVIHEKAKNFVDASTATVELYKTAGFLAEEASFNNLSRSIEITQPDKIMQTGDELLKTKRDKFSANSHTEPLTISSAAIEEDSTNRILGDTEMQEDYKTSSVGGRYSHSSYNESINDRQKRSDSEKRFESNLRVETKKYVDRLLTEIRKNLDELLTNLTLNKPLLFSNTYFEEKAKDFKETSTKTGEINVISEHSVYTLGNETKSKSPKKKVRSRSFESALHSEAAQTDIELLMVISKKLDGLISTDSFSETSNSSDFSSNEREIDFEDIIKETQESYVTSNDYADGRNYHRLVQRPVHGKLRGIISSSSFQSNYRDEVIQTDDQLITDVKKAGHELCSVNTQTEFLPSSNHLKAENYLDACTTTEEHCLPSYHPVARRNFHTLSNEPQHVQQKGIVRSESFESTLRSDMRQIDDSLFFKLKTKLDELLAFNGHTETEASSYDPIGETTKNFIDVSTETEEHHETSDHSVGRRNFHTLSNEHQDGRQKGIVRSKSFESTLRSEMKQIDDNLFLEIKTKLGELLASNRHTKTEASSNDPIGETTKNFVDVSTETEEHHETSYHSVGRRNFHTLSNEHQDGRQKGIVRSESFESTLRSEMKQIDDNLFLEIKTKLGELLASNRHTKTEAYSIDPIGETTKNFIDVSTETEEHHETSDHSVGRRNFHTLSNEHQDGRQKGIVRSKSFESTLRSEMKQIDDSLFLEITTKLGELLASNRHTKTEASSNDPIGETTKNFVDVSTETEEHHATSDHSVGRRNFHTLSNEHQDGRQKGIVRSESFESTLRSEMKQIDDSLFLEIKIKLGELLACNRQTKTEASSNDLFGETAKTFIDVSTETEEHHATSGHPVARINFDTLSNETRDGRHKGVVRSESFESTLRTEIHQPYYQREEMENKQDEENFVNEGTELLTFPNNATEDESVIIVRMDQYDASEHSEEEKYRATLSKEGINERRKRSFPSNSFESTLGDETQKDDDKHLIGIRKRLDELLARNTQTRALVGSHESVDEKVKECVDSTQKEDNFVRRKSHTIDNPQSTTEGSQNKIVDSRSFDTTLPHEVKEFDETILIKSRTKLDGFDAGNIQSKQSTFQQDNNDESTKSNVAVTPDTLEKDPSGDTAANGSKIIEQIQEKTQKHYHTIGHRPIIHKQGKIVRSKSFQSSLWNGIKQIDDESLIELKKKSDNVCSVKTQTEHLASRNDIIEEITKTYADACIETDRYYVNSDHSVARRNFHKLCNDSQNGSLRRIVRSKSFESTLLGEMKAIDDGLFLEIKKKLDELLAVNTHIDTKASSNEPTVETNKNYTDASNTIEEHSSVSNNSVARRNFHTLSNESQDERLKGIIRSESFESTFRSEMKQIDDSLFLEIKKKLVELLAVNTLTKTEASSNDPIGERTKTCIDVSTETEEHYATTDHSVAWRNFNISSYEPQKSRLKGIVRSKSFESTLAGEIKQADDKLLLEIKKKLSELLSTNNPTDRTAIPNDNIEKNVAISTEKGEHFFNLEHSLVEGYLTTSSRIFQTTQRDKIIQTDDELVTEHKKIRNELSVKTQTELVIFLNDSVEENAKPYADFNTEKEEVNETAERIFKATNRDEIKQIGNKMTKKCDGLTAARTRRNPLASKNESVKERREIFMDISSDTEEHHMCLEADVEAETFLNVFIDMCFEEVVKELISDGQIDDNDKEENETQQSMVPSAKKELHDEANDRDETTAAQLLQGHIAKLVPEVLENIESAAYIEPEKKEEVMKAICPWLTVEVAEEVGHIVDSREILTVIVEEIIKQRAAAYSDINDMPEIIANIEEIVENSNDGDNNRNDSKDVVIL